MKKRKFLALVCVLLVTALTLSVGQLYAQGPSGGSARDQASASQLREAEQPGTQGLDPDRIVTQEERQAAADRATAAGLQTGPDSVSGDREFKQGPGETPDYFGVANYANSPLPETVSTFTTFYFAEGTTRPGFDPYLCIQNPGAAEAFITITYMKGDGTTATQDWGVNPHTRLTVLPSSVLGVGDDAAHDFGTRVECTNGQQVFVERPMYFNYKEKWTGGHDVMGATSLENTFYFAEGYTGADVFEEWLTMLNPGATTTNAHITYMFPDGATQEQDVAIGATTRVNVLVNEVVGPDKEVSVKIEADDPIVAERPMYFNYKDKWTGGHDVMGSRNLGGTFYFAEGYTGADLFEEWLTVQNPGVVDANLVITYMFSDSSVYTQNLVVGPTSRATVNVNEEVGADRELSVKIESDQPILAERPMYFNYKGEWTGGHDAIGAMFTDSAFYFAEGTCRPDFDPYLTIQNPGGLPADVTVTYMKGDGTTATKTLSVPANTRSTVNPRETLGTGDDDAHDFSSVVECTNGQSIVVERPMYFNYNGAWTGGHDVMGFSFAANLTVVEGTGMRKFVDSLPGLSAANANNLGQYMPVAIPDTTTFPGSDYYEIELGEYTEQLHSDLPPTTLRGYRQTNTTDPSVSVFHYLGPAIVAERDVPVRVKFTNNLPMGEPGDLFIPVDTTVMGAGMGPDGVNMYMQNRAAVHLHGGATPWISDGTPHQWTTPVDEGATAYPKGVSVAYVPDMWFDANGDVVPQGTPGASNNPGPGRLTFFYTNQQSARLMFYHDHAYGITRLNVYAGEAAPYIVQDPVEKSLIDDGIIPAEQIPLTVQDKSFVPDAQQLSWQDPTWDTAKYGGEGNLWMPHVYMPNQNPADPGGMNAFGRWHYGPWFWPPTSNIEHGPVANPYYDPINAPWEYSQIPGTPTPSMAMESFMDTPMVNGTAYPTLEVDPKSYRLRILNAANDRFFNLQLYVADPTVTTPDGRTDTEVKMVPAEANPTFPPNWPTDGREGGVPDPATSGPEFIQIGTEGGFLPAPVVLPNQPVVWNNDPTTFNFGNVSDGTLILGPAERGDAIIDFSQYAGKTIILYNDAPAAFPARDPRYDYYTGAPDLTDTGGAPGVLPGYGPNIRTVMQIKVADSTPAPAYDLAALEAAFASTATTQGAFAASQDPIIVPSSDYDSAYNKTFPADPYVRIYDTSITFFNGPLPGLKVTDGGSGYTSAPGVAISGGDGTGATATAQVSGVTAVTLTGGGAGYTNAPAVDFTGGGGSGAAAYAQVSGVTTLTLNNGGGGYSMPPAVSFTGGGGSGAAAYSQIAGVTGFTITSGGTGYTTPPEVVLEGGGGTGATAVAVLTGDAVTGINLTNGGANYTSAPTVIFSGGGGTGAAATAAIGIGQVTGAILTNGGSGYTGAPTVVLTGGGGIGADVTAIVAPGEVTGVVLTDGGSGYTSAPAVGFTGGGGAGATADATIQPGAVTGVILTDPGDGYVSAPDITLTGGGGTGAVIEAVGLTIPFESKAIQDEQGEAFDPEYGRMSGFLGLELANIQPVNRGFVLYPFIAPPTDVTLDNVTASYPQAGDGTQVWKITHNGVDTHTIHWHLFNVQVVNRVAWDNSTRPPDPNELGWKETVRVNPLEDTIIAIRGYAPDLPFEVPSSVRLIDVTMPEGSPLQGAPGGYMDTQGNPIAIYNQYVNFGWEYVLHCHLLGHEEMDMMHGFPFAVAPWAPTNLTAAGPVGNVVLNWTDNSVVETSLIVEYADNLDGPWTFLTELPADTVTYTDTSTFAGTRYYRVFARNAVGSTVPTFPVINADSAPAVSNAAPTL